MCGVAEAAIVASVVSAIGTVQQGRIQKRNLQNQEAVARYTAESQITELKEQKELNKIRAREEEIQRRRLLEADMSAITAYNRGLESTSKQNIKDTSAELFGADVATNRFNLAVAQRSADRQIGVLNVQANMPSQASGIMTASYISAMSTVTSAYGNYRQTRVPNTGPTTTTAPTVTSSYTPGGTTNKTTGFANKGYTFTG